MRGKELRLSLPVSKGVDEGRRRRCWWFIEAERVHKAELLCNLCYVAVVEISKLLRNLSVGSFWLHFQNFLGVWTWGQNEYSSARHTQHEKLVSLFELTDSIHLKRFWVPVVSRVTDRTNELILRPCEKNFLNSSAYSFWRRTTLGFFSTKSSMKEEFQKYSSVIKRTVLLPCASAET